MPLAAVGAPVAVLEGLTFSLEKGQITQQPL